MAVLDAHLVLLTSFLIANQLYLGRSRFSPSPDSIRAFEEVGGSMKVYCRWGLRYIHAMW